MSLRSMEGALRMDADFPADGNHYANNSGSTVCSNTSISSGSMYL